MRGFIRSLGNLLLQISARVTVFWGRGAPRRARAFQWAARHPALVAGLTSIFIAVPLWGLAIMGSWSFWYPVLASISAIVFILIAYGLLSRVLDAFWSAFLWVLRMFGLGIGRMFGSIFKHKDPAWFTALTIIFLLGTILGESLFYIVRDLAIILYSIGFLFGGVGAIIYLVLYWKRPVRAQGGKLAMISFGSLLVVLGCLLWTFTTLNGNLALIYMGVTGILKLLGVAVFTTKENT